MSEPELAGEQLIRGVVNFDLKRGDQVTVVATPFDPAAELENLMPWYENVMLLNNQRHRCDGCLCDDRIRLDSSCRV